MTHMSDSLLERFARRDLRSEEIVALEEHLAGCEACARKAHGRAAAAGAQLRRHFLDDAPAPLVHPSSDLKRFARGRLHPEAAELVEGHLDECRDCTILVENYRGQRGGGYRWMWLAAAAALAVVISSLVVWRTPAPAPERPAVVRRQAPPPERKRIRVTEPPQTVAAAYADPRWEALVHEADRAGRVRVPEATLAELRAAQDVVRGRNWEAERVAPAGRVVDDARPAFTWPAREDATYTVFVFDGEREVARSGPQSGTRWTPPSDLPRGRTLTWQVEAAYGDTIETIPRPPAPPARFRITSASEHRELARARAAHPGDPLLLGLLQAQAGLLDEARASLRRAAGTNPTARKLLTGL